MLNTTIYKLTTEVFTKPFRGNVLIYSPLKKIAFFVNDDGLEIIKRLRNYPIEASGLSKKQMHFADRLVEYGVVNGEKDIHPTNNRSHLPDRLMLLLTSDCNLKCTYCFSNGGEEKSSISKEAAVAAVDMVISNVIETGNTLLRMSFHGGGEPTLEWELLSWITEYARSKASEKGLTSYINIVSNCVWTQPQRDWIFNNIDQITISLDGYPELNDLHRLMANGTKITTNVIETIKDMKKRNYPVRIRSTVSEYNVGYLPDIIDYFHELGAAAVQFEPLTFIGRAVESNIKSPDAKKFIKYYSKAFERAREKGMTLNCSGVRLHRHGEIFCSAAGKMFCVTPDEHITSCHRVSSKSNPQSRVFYYGYFDSTNKKYIIDYSNLEKLKLLSVTSSPTCKKCLAKWHCAGGCYEQNIVCSDDPQTPANYRCTITKELTIRRLAYDIDKLNIDKTTSMCIC